MNLSSHELFFAIFSIIVRHEEENKDERRDEGELSFPWNLLQLLHFLGLNNWWAEVGHKIISWLSLDKHLMLKSLHGCSGRTCCMKSWTTVSHCLSSPSFSWSKGERTGEDRRLPTVETRTFFFWFSFSSFFFFGFIIYVPASKRWRESFGNCSWTHQTNKRLFGDCWFVPPGNRIGWWSVVNLSFSFPLFSFGISFGWGKWV